MQIMLYSKGFHLDEEKTLFIRDRVNFILSRFSNLISKVEIFMSDENGPKGGIDKSCIIIIRTNQFSDIVIKDMKEDLPNLVSRALTRAKQTLIRRIKRSHSNKDKNYAYQSEGEVSIQH